MAFAHFVPYHDPHMMVDPRAGSILLKSKSAPTSKNCCVEAQNPLTDIWKKVCRV